MAHEYFADLPAVVPEVGHFYYLRAGLIAVITEEIQIYGIRMWKGYILERDRFEGLNVWHGSGAYSPVRFVKHELDIVWEKT